MTDRTGSLRGRLLKMIILPLLAVAAIAIAARYYEAKRTSQTLYDNALLSIAHVITRDVVLTDGDVLAEKLLETLTEALGDQIFYHVAGDTGSVLITGYTNPPKPPAGVTPKPNEPVFYDQTYRGDSVRVVALREFISATPFNGWVNVTVWQRTGQREALRIRLTGLSLAVMGLIILAAAAIVWFGVSFGLKPLLDLQDAIEKRSPDDLGGIRRTVPREVSSLVSSMNALFGQLRNAFAEKDAFIANAAHQLRNPVAGIQSQAEAAENANEPEELRNRIGDVAEAARRTSRLIEQMLSMERVSQRSLKDSFEDVDVSAIVSETVTRAAPRAMKQEVDISLAGANDPIPARGNPTLLGEVFDNLLDNALRYGCPEGGTIAVETTRTADTASVTIRDSGPGIPEELLPQIFERFTRGTEDGSDGCGLGLAIARSIIEGHGGIIRFKNDGRGTCVRIELPCSDRSV